MVDFATLMAGARGLHLAAAVSLLGTAGFILWMLPAAGAVPDRLRDRLVRLGWISGLIALLAGGAWFTLQAAAMADAGDISAVAGALPVVAVHTRFGTVLMLRLGLLLAATVLMGGAAVRRPHGEPVPSGGRPVAAGTSTDRQAADGASGRPSRVGSSLSNDGTGERPGEEARGREGRATEGSERQAPGDKSPGGKSPGREGPAGRWLLHLTLLLAGTALGLEGLIGHAGAAGGMVGGGLVISEAGHLLAAGIWLGALLPLLFSVRALPPTGAAAVCERFSPIGLACVLVVAGTGLAQGLQLIGGLPALFGTRYGHVALLKIALFLGALGLAALNRLWLTDRLVAGTAGARRQLLVSIGCETCAAIAIVGAAAFMASAPPAAHTTPVWPFSWQFSLITVNEDPDLRQEVVISLVAIGIAVALMAGALLWGRLRLIALAVLFLAVTLRGPSFSLLTVEAYPTSFQTSPTGFSADSIARGQTVFAQNCVTCHGNGAEGDGPAAPGLRIKPADLTLPHLWEHTDGVMFWWLTHGIDDPEGGLAMPGFGRILTPDDRWAVIDYVRAHNAGVAMRESSPAVLPVQAPAFPLNCSGLAASRMDDLRGHAVHVVTDATSELEIPPQAGVTTINVALRSGASIPAGSCVAATSAAWQALAILADMPDDALTGAEFLIDPNGWLRAVRRPGVANGWRTRDGLIAAIRGICASPIEHPIGDEHEHHH